MNEDGIYEPQSVRHYETMTLCELCDRACGGCSWSQRLEPVPGWDAVQGTADTGWSVLDCPEKEIPERYRQYCENFRPEKIRAMKSGTAYIQRQEAALHSAVSQLYRQGLPDQEIARKLGISIHEAERWRILHHLPPHLPRAPRAALDIERGYLRGLPDKEIARETERLVITVKAWRRRRGLPPNRGGR